MKQILISDDTYEFAKKLVHEMETQDNRMTTKPILFEIHQDWFEYVVEPLDYDSNVEQVLVCPELEAEFFDIQSFIDYLKDDDDMDDLLQKIYSMLKEAESTYNIYDNDIDMLYDALEDELTEYFPGMSKLCRITHHTLKNGNVFLTESACKEFIKQNAHHLNNPTIYVHSFWRNYEMKNVVDLINEIVKGEKHDS